MAGAEGVLFAASALTAALGVVVAALAARGYRRNDSPTMGLLALAVVCIAVLPFGLTYGLAPALALSDALALFCVLCAHVVGLLAMLASLDAV
jgi:hypothetical protein